MVPRLPHRRREHRLPTMTLFITTAVAAHLFLLPGTVTANDAAAAHTKDLKVKFYSDVSMICDHPDLNVTSDPNVKAISWLFPDGSLVKGHNGLENARHFFFSPPAPEEQVAVTDRSVFETFNLTVQMVDDKLFGYYTCIVVYSSAGGNGEDVSAIRWGLNVNGADFSELEETYKENAIVGGIAAAVMLVLVGGGCLLWHFHYGKRHIDDDVKKSGLEDLDNQLDADSKIAETSLDEKRSHVNDGYAVDTALEMSDVDLGPDGAANVKDGTTDQASGSNGVSMKL